MVFNRRRQKKSYFEDCTESLWRRHDRWRCWWCWRR